MSTFRLHSYVYHIVQYINYQTLACTTNYHLNKTVLVQANMFIYMKSAIMNVIFIAKNVSQNNIMLQIQAATILVISLISSTQKKNVILMNRIANHITKEICSKVGSFAGFCHHCLVTMGGKINEFLAILWKRFGGRKFFNKLKPFKLLLSIKYLD